MELAPITRDDEFVNMDKLPPTKEHVPVTKSPTTFVSTIDEWIDIFGNESDVQKDTFTDTEGVERFRDNWRTVSVNEKATNRTSEELATTGCVTIPIRLCEHFSDRSNNRIRYVNFSLNFRALWEHNEKDNADEVTDYSPLFRTYVELFFHQRTVQIMLVFSVYYIAAIMAIDTVYIISPPVSRAIFYFNYCLQTFVYLALVILLKGTLFSAAPKVGTTLAGASCKENNEANYYRSKQPLNWIYYMKEAWRLSYAEMIQLYCTPKNARKGKTTKREAQKTVPFYETLNIGLKFITKHSKHSGDKLNLNRPANNYKLLFIFFAVPLYVLITTYASPIGPYQIYVKVCRTNGWDSVYCKNFNTLFITTLGYSIPVVVKILFISGVLLSLVGLGLGAEIGCALVDSWILRFGSLRTLKVDAVQSDIEAGQQRKAKKVVSTPAASSSAPTPVNGKSSMQSNGVNNGVINAMHAFGGLPSSTAGLYGSSGEVVSAQSAEVLIYLQRDSYEHYLYVREFMSTASRAWSFTIIAFTFMACFFIMLFLSMGIINSANITMIQWVYYTFWVAIRLTLLSVYPITSLARANAYVYALQEQFLVAAPEDFAVIGGRDSWLEYLDKVPALWTIYGLTITWDRLSGLLWTGVAGIGAIAISAAVSSS